MAFLILRNTVALVCSEALSASFTSAALRLDPNDARHGTSYPISVFGQGVRHISCLSTDTFRSSQKPDTTFQPRTLQSTTKTMFCLSLVQVANQEIVTEASRAVGKEPKVEKVPYDQAVEGILKRFAKGGDGEPMRDGRERLLLYYKRRGLVGSPTVLEWLRGREATTPSA